MQRRSRQSELLTARASFQPTQQWTRISFLDIVGDEGAPIYQLEPAYVDGATVIAVWPPTREYDAVTVMLWAPDAPTLELLHVLQLDWPASLSDLRVRRNSIGVMELAPCPSNFARSAARSTGELARQVRQILDRGARALGRSVCLAG